MVDSYDCGRALFPLLQCLPGDPPRDLIWASFFVLNVGFWLVLRQLDWFSVLACQLPVSVGVIAWEVKATRYHGIFADRLNTHLQDYLERRIP